MAKKEVFMEVPVGHGRTEKVQVPFIEEIDWTAMTLRVAVEEYIFQNDAKLSDFEHDFHLYTVVYLHDDAVLAGSRTVFSDRGNGLYFIDTDISRWKAVYEGLKVLLSMTEGQYFELLEERIDPHLEDLSDTFFAERSESLPQEVLDKTLVKELLMKVESSFEDISCLDSVAVKSLETHQVVFSEGPIA